MLTFYDLQQAVLTWIDEGDDASTGTTRALVKDALNRSHRKILSSRTWPFMRWPSEVAFDTVPGQRTYSLKHGISKVLTLWDEELSQPTPLVSRREWETMGIDRVGSQAVPAGAIYGDAWPVLTQPAASSTGLRVVASDILDLNNINVFVTVTGLDSSGNYATKSIAPDSDPPTYGNALSHILSVTKRGSWAGSMTLVDSTTQTLLTLEPSEYAKQYPTLEFIETPRDARTYLYTAQRTPTVLSADRDIPDTPFPFSEIHVYDALLDISAYNTELTAKHQTLWRARYQELLDGLMDACDEAIAGSRPRFVRNMNERLVGRIHSTGS